MTYTPPQLDDTRTLDEILYSFEAERKVRKREVARKSWNRNYGGGKLVRTQKYNPELRKRDPDRYREYERKWRLANPEKIKIANSKYKVKNQEKILDACLRRTYGIGVFEYRSMEYVQDGVCKVCSRLNTNGKRLCVDHCHSTGVIRGLLCCMCNGAAGLADDCPDRLLAIAEYVKRGELDGWQIYPSVCA